MWFVPYELKKTNKLVSELGQLLKTEKRRGTGEMVRQSQAPATKPGNLVPSPEHTAAPTQTVNTC